MATYLQGYYEDGTAVVSFDDDSIETTLTDSGDVADSWVAETYRLHHRGNVVAGLDVEWRPARVPGRVAVLQICVDHRGLVFQILRADHVPARLYSFLADRRFTSVGVGVRDDATKLRAGYGLRVASTIELRVAATIAIGRPDLHRAGLQALVWEVKGDGRADGEVVPRPRQRVGRAGALGGPSTDAFSSFEVGLRLHDGEY
jgi:hypothetical protein